MTFLGHVFKNGTISPDPGRLVSLINFPALTNTKQLERPLGIFVYYGKWVQNFSKIFLPLFTAKFSGIFPFKKDAISAIKTLKQLISYASLAVPVHRVPLLLATDVFLTSIGAAHCVLLSQAK